MSRLFAECSIRLAASSSGVSSWMAKNQDLGIAFVSFGAREGSATAGFGVGLYEEMVPLRAASMEKGRAPAPLVLNDGGSTRRKGEELARRPLESKPTRLCLGEPRLREIEEILLVVGTDRDRAFRLMTGELTGVETRLKCCFVDFMGVPSKALAFLDGEARMFGSTFSLSNSSKVSGEKLRLLDLVSKFLPEGSS